MEEFPILEPERRASAATVLSSRSAIQNWPRRRSRRDAPRINSLQPAESAKIPGAGVTGSGTGDFPRSGSSARVSTADNRVCSGRALRAHPHRFSRLLPYAAASCTGSPNRSGLRPRPTRSSRAPVDGRHRRGWTPVSWVPPPACPRCAGGGSPCSTATARWPRTRRGRWPSPSAVPEQPDPPRSQVPPGRPALGQRRRRE
jgi:hypothetical protein